MAEVSGGLLLGGIMIMMILCVPQAKTEYLMGEIRWEELTDGTNVFINPAERDRQTDQEASIRTRLHGERCPDRDGI